MTNKSREPLQKVEIHGQGVSGFSASDVERRARELASIDGRGEASDIDRERALAEFRAAHLPDPINEDLDSMTSLSRDPSDPMVERGRQIPDRGGDDEKAALERLALEGVEEAQHDQMLESRNESAEERPPRKKT